MHLIRMRRPSPAMVVALLAFFVASSGAAYAATGTLIGTAQIKDGAVTTPKLHDSAVTTRKLHDSAVTTRKLYNGAVTAAKLGTNSVNSAKVADGSLLARDMRPGQIQSALNVLSPGHTETGAYALGGPSPEADTPFVVAVSFPIPLAAALNSSHVVYVVGASAPNCPGPGRAARGYLCLYETYSINIKHDTSLHILNPGLASVANGAGRYGFVFTGQSVGTNPSNYMWGTWAVTG